MPFLQPVSSYMSTHLLIATMNATLPEVARSLDDRRVSSVPVIDRNGGLAGVISRTDLLHAGRVERGVGRRELHLVVPELPAGALLSRPPLVCPSERSMRDAARRMVADCVHRLYVVDRDRLVGVISTRDLTRAVRDARVSAPLRDVAAREVVTVPGSTPIAAALARRQLVATDLVVLDGGWPIGIFTALDALAARDLPPATLVQDACDRAFICLPADTAMHHAAAQAAALDVKRVLAFVGGEIVGLASGLDLARLVAA